MKVAVYPGSFDPITYGHIDIAKRALKVFDKLIILISVNPNKESLFTAKERIEMVKATINDFVYEFQMTHANRVLEKSVDSIFFMTDNKYSFLSSTTVKEIAQFNGDLSTFVPPYVEQKIIDKFE